MTTPTQALSQQAEQEAAARYTLKTSVAAFADGAEWALAQPQPSAPSVEPREWSEAEAVALAHRAGFAGTCWWMGPEELVHMLNMAGAAPLMANDLTPSETAATASVAGLGEPLTIYTAPLGTKAPAIMGGHWIKVAKGWKWHTGNTFSTPGGDWTGKLIAPVPAAEEPEPAFADPEGMPWLLSINAAQRIGNLHRVRVGTVQAIAKAVQELHDAPAVATPTAPPAPAAVPPNPDGRLHDDGYFTWERRDGYAMDKRLPCDFYLAPTVKEFLTVAAQPSAAPLPAREPAMPAEVECDALSAWHTYWRSHYMTEGADKVPPQFLTAFTAGYRAAEQSWGITLAAAPAAQSSTKGPGHE